MARKATSYEQAVANGKLLDIKRRLNPMTPLFDATRREHNSGRRKGILSKSPGVDEGNVAAGGVKPGTYAREENDYRVTGKNTHHSQYVPKSAREGVHRSDHYIAYEQARNKGQTPTQAERTAGGTRVNSSLRYGKGTDRPTPRQQAAKDRGGRKTFLERQKTVETVKNTIKQGKRAVVRKTKKGPHLHTDKLTAKKR
ncbi:MAG: hypothetical protein J6V01_08525 [Clostridia bacterium]|nr:hypothetical protein [Clostridia bacterium]